MPETEPKTGKLSSFLLDILQTIVLALAIFMIAYLFLFQPHQVKGHSMDPNFSDGEYLLTDKLSYRFGEPKRGDVVVFEAPVNRREDYIKRILALPGENVMVKDGKVLINGRPLDEEYIPETFRTNPGVYLADGSTITLRPDEYIVMGDNRDHSSDSRSWGPVKKSDLVGRAWVIYWPPKLWGLVKGEKYKPLN